MALLMNDVISRTTARGPARIALDGCSAPNDRELAALLAWLTDVSLLEPLPIRSLGKDRL